MSVKKMKKSAWGRRVAGVGAAFAVTMVVAFGAAPAAQAAPTSGDPISTGCSNGAYTVKSWGMYNSRYGQYQGSIELRYSPKCGTNWIRVTSTVRGNMVWGSISTDGNPFTAKNAGRGAVDVSQQWSPMIYAPGGTCVLVSGMITDTATNATEGRLDYQRVC